MIFGGTSAGRRVRDETGGPTSGSSSSPFPLAGVVTDPRLPKL